MTMPIIEESKSGETKNTFPISMQLGILFLLLGGVFGSLWMYSTASTQTEPEELPAINVTKTTADRNFATLHELDEVSLIADAAYVWDIRGQRSLFKKNESHVLPIASITKLMTTLLAYELMAESHNLTIDGEALSQEGNSGLRNGELLSLEDVTQFALISSSNDAAYSLAASVGTALGDDSPTDQFVAAMNIRADELGLYSMEFSNMTGLDLDRYTPGAVASARDVSFLFEYIIEHYPELVAGTQSETVRIFNEVGEYHDVRNTNPVTERIPALIGSKTGYTDLAGGNLTIAFDLAHDRPIIITVLGSTRDARFSDVLTLVEAVQAAVNQNVAHE